jgi:hypothetical protein
MTDPVVVFLAVILCRAGKMLGGMQTRAWYHLHFCQFVGVKASSSSELL